MAFNPQETLTRRGLFNRAFEASKLATIALPFLVGCSPTTDQRTAPLAPSASGIDQKVSAPPAFPDFKNFDEQIATMTKGGFINMLKMPHPQSNGVTADLLKFDYDDKQGIITARWRVESWRIFKEVEIKDIKTDNLANIPLTPADQANGVSVQGRADLNWIWKQAPLTGDLSNPQRGTWGEYHNGSERFTCELGKTVACNISTPVFKDNWPPLGSLYEMVFYDPVHPAFGRP